MATDFVLGLDLGQAADFTALAVLQREGLGKEVEYALRHLERFPLGTPYPAIVEALGIFLQKAKLGCPALVVDQTGVGRAVVDLLRQARLGVRLVPVTITAGQEVSVAPDGGYRVPKKDLVTGLQVVLQSKRMRIPRDLPEARTLMAELSTFQVKITTSAHETFGVWREGSHDDLVLALGLACWWAEKFSHFGPATSGVGPPCLAMRAPPGTFHSGDCQSTAKVAGWAWSLRIALGVDRTGVGKAPMRCLADELRGRVTCRIVSINGEPRRWGSSCGGLRSGLLADFRIETYQFLVGCEQQGDPLAIPLQMCRIASLSVPLGRKARCARCS